MRKLNKTQKLTLSAMFLALGLVLPFLTGQIPQVGSMLLPMHLPVLLCGFVCGWPYGLVVGLITPLLRSLLFQMPPLMPTALCMAFELAAYGAVSGALYAAFRRTPGGLYAALGLALLAGRAVWGLASWAIYSLFTAKAFTPAIFVGGAFVNAWPGIALQIVLVPLLVLALQRAKLIPAAGAPSDAPADESAPEA